MKNTALVTISTIRRTWVLPLGKATRIFVLLLSTVIICALGAGSLIIYQFSQRIDSLEAKRQELRGTVISLNSSSELLQQKIQSQEFSLVKLLELEQLAGTELDDLSKDSLVFSGEGVELSPTKQSQLLERFDNAKTSLFERKWMMQVIPSGLPMVKKTYVTSPFGQRIHPITKQKQFHYGLDMITGIGDDIIVTADGVVEFSSYNTGGYGNMIRISHSYGFTTAYAHLSKRLVKRGDVVTKGQVIGKSGNSGISTGPHLHYEVIFLEKKLNPYPFVKWSLNNYEQLFSTEKNVRWSMLIDQVKSRIARVNRVNNGQAKSRPTSTLKSN